MRTHIVFCPDLENVDLPDEVEADKMDIKDGCLCFYHTSMDGYEQMVTVYAPGSFTSAMIKPDDPTCRHSDGLNAEDIKGLPLRKPGRPRTHTEETV